MSLRDERVEVSVRAQVGVDGEVVGRVVPVVGRRGEDGVEVQRRDAPLGKVVEVRRDAREVAAVEVAAQRLLLADELLVGAAVALGSLVPGLGQDAVAVHVSVSEARRAIGSGSRIGRRVVGGVAVGESVRKDLVDDRSSRPVGRSEGRVVDGELPAGAGRRLAQDGARAAIEGVVVGHETARLAVLGHERVLQHGGRDGRLERDRPVVDPVLTRVGIGGDPRHRQRTGIAGEGVRNADLGRGQVARRRAQPQLDRAAGRHGPGRAAIQVRPAVVLQVGLAHAAVDREWRAGRYRGRRCG